MRQHTFIDKLLIDFDLGVRAISGHSPVSERPSPGDTIEALPLAEKERRHSAGLMRVDHAGEVCAQGLYQGQALTARNDVVKQNMRQAALEEQDHLYWCEKRLRELNSHTSYLNSLWYMGSVGIGALAGVLGDDLSLGFVVETEKQVMKHLDKHLDELPVDDHKSQRILKQMRIDEEQHANKALTAGAQALPWPVKQLMALTSKAMTVTAYWI